MTYSHRIFVIMLICCTIIISTVPLLAAEEYQAPEDLYDLMYETYDILTDSIVFDEHLFVDFYLFDENWFAISALEWGSINQMPLDQIQAYYQESIELYDPATHFMLLVMVNHDLGEALNLTELTSQIGIYNSKNEVIFGTDTKSFGDSIFVISYPRDQVDKHLGNDDRITIQFKVGSTPSPQITFERNYKNSIPEKMTELVQLLGQHQ